MKAATVREIKKELQSRSPEELVEMCLHLSRFKKENKELLTYLLYDSLDEEGYIQGIKDEMDELFAGINKGSSYYFNKTARKILRIVKKYIRYSKKKQTEIEVLIYFCEQISHFGNMYSNMALQGIYDRQVKTIKKALTYLHEDLQYDYQQIINEMR